MSNQQSKLAAVRTFADDMKKMQGPDSAAPDKSTASKAKPAEVDTTIAPPPIPKKESTKTESSKQDESDSVAATPIPKKTNPDTESPSQDKSPVGGAGNPPFHQLEQKRNQPKRTHNVTKLDDTAADLSSHPESILDHQPSGELHVGAEETSTATIVSDRKVSRPNVFQNVAQGLQEWAIDFKNTYITPPKPSYRVGRSERRAGVLQNAGPSTGAKHVSHGSIEERIRQRYQEERQETESTNTTDAQATDPVFLLELPPGEDMVATAVGATSKPRKSIQTPKPAPVPARTESAASKSDSTVSKTTASALTPIPTPPPHQTPAGNIQSEKPTAPTETKAKSTDKPETETRSSIATPPTTTEKDIDAGITKPAPAAGSDNSFTNDTTEKVTASMAAPAAPELEEAVEPTPPPIPKVAPEVEPVASAEPPTPETIPATPEESYTPPVPDETFESAPNEFYEDDEDDLRDQEQRAEQARTNTLSTQIVAAGVGVVVLALVGYGIATLFTGGQPSVAAVIGNAVLTVTLDDYTPAAERIRALQTAALESSSEITQVTPYRRTADGLEIATAGDTITALNLTIPEAVASNLRTMHFGSRNDALFLYVSIVDERQTFGALLRWESDMVRDLEPIFAITDSGTFQDTAINGYDARVYMQNNTPQLTYAVLDGYVLITTTPAVLERLIPSRR